MSDENPPRLAGPLAVAVALAAAAGFVDAHLFVHVVQVFVANMSGNLVLLGLAVGDRRWSEVGLHLVALATFTAGIAAGTLVHDRRRATGRKLRPDLVLATEALLLVAVMGLRAIQGPTDVLVVEAMDVPVIALGALAMGLQNVVIGRVGKVAVTTTYESGSVARIGEEAALGLRSREAERRSHHVAVIRVLATIVAAYVAGAAAAAALGSSPALLLVPTAVVVMAAAVLRRTGTGQSSAKMP